MTNKSFSPASFRVVRHGKFSSPGPRETASSIPWRILAAGVALTLAVGSFLAASERSNDQAGKRSGEKLLKITVHPARLALARSGVSHGLSVTGHYADGGLRDVTEKCKFTSADASIAEVSPQGVIRPQANGNVDITASLGKAKAASSLTVTRMEDASYNFTNDVLPVISRLKCNQMGCHGSPKGKEQLHLSLFGADPGKDFQQIIDPKKKFLVQDDSASSLLLVKATGYDDHGGGERTDESEQEYKLLADWISQGAPKGSEEDPTLARLEVFPAKRVLTGGGKQRLLVDAHYSDGSTRDVTRLASFTSSDDLIATVSDLGAAEATGHGEAIIMIGFGGLAATSRLAVPQPLPIPFPDVPANNRVDEFVTAKHRALGIIPSPPASDSEFLRRVHLDAIGMLPTPEEAKAFLDDARSDKRSRLIDALLARDAFADMWSAKWGDLLRINREQPSNLREKGMWTYYRWLWESIQQNKPMDQFVTELLTARGSNYRVGPANFYRVARDPQAMAEHTSTLFLGARLDCAHCHNHPFEQFTWDDNLGLAAFFSRVRKKTTPEAD
ncbi:MAG: DUF1549 domain-containing protein, partial [Planctomycetales bacterium]